MPVERRAATLEIRLLGPLEAFLDGRKVTPPASRRSWALLGYLALRPGALPRSEVAAAMWPDVHDTCARGSLRTAAWALRRALGGDAEARLEATRETIGLADDGKLWTDMREFLAAVAAGRLRSALALERGPLLHGIDDEWALLERDAFEEWVAGRLGALTLGAMERGDGAHAVRWARRRAHITPRDEPAARALMVALAVEGERAAALEVYGALSGRLSRELGVEPAPATRELAGRIRVGGCVAAAGRPPRSLLRLIQRDQERVATDAPRARG